MLSRQPTQINDVTSCRERSTTKYLGKFRYHRKIGYSPNAFANADSDLGRIKRSGVAGVTTRGQVFDAGRIDHANDSSHLIGDIYITGIVDGQ
jgi:hypothetical protein